MWYYETDEQREGPVDDAELLRLIRSGIVSVNSMVWKPGMPAWSSVMQAAPMLFFQATGTAVERCAQCGAAHPQVEGIELMGQRICSACKVTALQNLKVGSFEEGLATEERCGPLWENRNGMPLARAFFATVREGMFRTGKFFTEIKPNTGRSIPPIIFCALGGLLGEIAMLPIEPVLVASGVLDAIDPILASTMCGASSLEEFALNMGLVLVEPLIAGGLAQLGLLFIAGKRTSFETTFRVHCYSSGIGAVITAIPFAGYFLALVYAFYAQVLGLARAHRIAVWRAAAATFGPLVALCAVLAVPLFGSRLIRGLFEIL
jgi:hypothetical protein